MKTKTLPRSETVRFGWEIAKKHFVFFLKVFVAIFLVTLAFQAVSYLLQEQPSFITGVVTIISIIIGYILDLGLIKIILNFADSKQSEISTLFSITKPRTIFKYFVGDLIYNLVVVLGIIFFIIPGIYLAIKLHYYRYLIVDKDLGLFEAFNESARLTQGVKMELFKFYLVLILMNIIGFFAFLVGLLLTVPTYMVADATMFRKLQKMHS